MFAVASQLVKVEPQNEAWWISIQEAMRLWPTTPMLMRQTVEDEILGGNTIPKGTQVLILNGFNHRDWETNPDAGSFCPDFWLDKRSDYGSITLAMELRSVPARARHCSSKSGPCRPACARAATS